MMQIIDEGEDPNRYSIPIYPMNPGIWNGDYYFEDLPLAYKLAALLYRPKNNYWQIQGEDGAGSWKHVAAAYHLFNELQPTGVISMESLYKLFSRQRTPLRYIPGVLNMIDYNTGTIFFDFDYEMGDPDIPWSKENIEWLRKQYKLAIRIERKINSLENWLSAEPKERLTQAFHLFNQLKKLPDENPKKK